MQSVTEVRPSLKRRALSAGSWSAVGYGGAQVLRLVSSLILTRLLTPDLFGLFAITTIVQTIFGLLSDVGLRQSVVQSQRGGEPDFLSTIWTMQVARGLFIWLFSSLTGIVLYGLARSGQFPTDSVYASSQLPWLLLATGAVTFVDSLHSVKVLEHQRNLNLRRLNIIELICQVAGIATTISVAWYSRSAWAIVAGGMMQSVLHVVLTHAFLTGHRVGFGWNPIIVKEVVRLGRWIVISSSFSIFAMNADRMLLGGWASAEVLGFYALALSMYMVFAGAVEGLNAMVIFPLLSEAARSGEEAFQRLYSKIKLPYDSLLILVAGGIWGSADWVVRLMFDPRYQPVGDILKILSLGLILARTALPGVAYMAKGRTRNLSVASGVLLVSTWTIVPLAYHLYGITGALYAIALRSLTTLPVIYRFNQSLHLNRWTTEIVSLLAWPVGFALGSVVSHVGARIQ